MDFQAELKKFQDRIKTLWGHVVKWVLKKLEERHARMSKDAQIRNPRDRYSGMNFKNTQEEFSEFQKRRDLKPAAEDEDLSKVIDDVLQQTAPSDDGGLYAKKTPKRP